MLSLGGRHSLLGAALAVLAGCGVGSGTDGGSAMDVSEAAAAIPSDGPRAVRRARLLEANAELDLRDAPLRFRAELERNNGSVDTVDLPVTSVSDTTVARVVDGAVQAREVGTANLRFDFTPSLRFRGVLMVHERLAADSVWLSRGQVRAWDLRPGWHRITVDAKAPPGEPQPLELAADLICVPDARGPKETIICRVRQNTRVLLRHTGVGSQVGPALAVVEISRLPR